MKLYTIIFIQRDECPPRPPVLRELSTMLVEAETEHLARIRAITSIYERSYSVVAELGDTRENHPGTQDMIFEPAQVDIEEVIPS